MSDDKWVKSVYVIKKGNAKGFKFVITVDDKPVMIEFENCKYEAETAKHAEIIDDLIATRPAISGFIQKVDYAAAERVAELHRQSVRLSAAKGGMTTEIMRSMESTVAAKDVQNMADAIKDDSGMIITQDVDQPDITISPSIGIKIGN